MHNGELHAHLVGVELPNGPLQDQIADRPGPKATAYAGIGGQGASEVFHRHLICLCMTSRRQRAWRHVWEEVRLDQCSELFPIGGGKYVGEVLERSGPRVRLILDPACHCVGVHAQRFGHALPLSGERR